MFNVGVFTVYILAGLLTGVAVTLSLFEARWLPITAYALSAVVGSLSFGWYILSNMWRY